MTCNDCGITVPPGEQWPDSGGYILCNDRVACTERLLEAGKTAAKETEDVQA